MRIPIDRRATLGACVILLFSLVLGLVGLRHFLITLTEIVLFCCHLAFFRDPARKTDGAGQASVLSPAQGKVVEITEVLEDDYLHQPALKVGIFLSVFDVHVTRAPRGGSVKYLRYVPGKFLNALNPRSARENESNSIGIEEAGRQFLVRQITGAIARRIFCDVQVDSQVQRGDKLGMICYGSRVECYLPVKDFRLQVKLGDRVKAGETILGEWIS